MAPPEPHCATLQPSRNPAGAMCDFLFFNPLETEFENVVLTKNVALAMLYQVNLEKLKKVYSLAFYSNFRLVGARNNLVGARTIFGVKF